MGERYRNKERKLMKEEIDREREKDRIGKIRRHNNLRR